MLSHNFMDDREGCTDFFRTTLLFGGDYNPDQWLDRPDVLEEDIRLMKAAGVTVVSLGIFAWSSLEPEEGVFNFTWLDDAFARLHGAGISIFLATPTGARPAWMAEKYPEVLRVRHDGKRNLFGERHNHCYSSSVYREKTAIINKKLAERYGKHPAVKLWHISNEYRGECHCEQCQENFRSYLAERYGTLDVLNKAWWSSFWSHTVTSWDQIHSPVPHGEKSVHGLTVDWHRFVTHMTVDFMRHEVASVKEGGGDLPVTSNMMASAEEARMDPGLDYWKFRDDMDIASWDSYPAWHLPGYKNLPTDVEAESSQPVDDFRRAVEEGFQHDLFRSLSGGPFLLMESTPSNVNWQQFSKIKKPGMIKLTGLSALAHGANSVQYFQWRKARGSFEKFHGAFVGHDGGGDRRIFQELSELGQLLQELAPVADSDVKAEAAVLYNWENRWAIEASRDCVNSSRKAYLETVKKHHLALTKQGVQCDIISGDESIEQLGRYKLIVAPMLYMVHGSPDGTAQKLESFLESGGTLVGTYRSGYVDESDLCYESFPPGPLARLFGLEVEECDALYPGEAVFIQDSLKNQRGAVETAGVSGIDGAGVSDYQDLIRDDLTATVISRFSGGLADGKPALLRNDFGKGRAWYLAGRLDLSALEELYRDIIEKAGVDSVHRDVVRKSPALLIKERGSADGRCYRFLLNFSPEAGFVEFAGGERRLVEFEGDTGKRVELGPWGAEVITCGGKG